MVSCPWINVNKVKINIDKVEENCYYIVINPPSVEKSY